MDDLNLTDFVSSGLFMWCLRFMKLRGVMVVKILISGIAGNHSNIVKILLQILNFGIQNDFKLRYSPA